MAMPRLLLMDLDNTLIDRAALFRGWAADFLTRHALPPGDLTWLEEQDGDGLVPKPQFFERVLARYGLDSSSEALTEEYFERYPAFTVPPPAETVGCLEALRERGWRLGIVTNGPPMQQAVVNNAGLRHLVDTVCVSATVGLRKPDPAIFHLAAERCGVSAAGNWMLGDSASHDIAGAFASDMHAGWISRGRTWDETARPPTLIADGVPRAVQELLELT